MQIDVSPAFKHGKLNICHHVDRQSMEKSILCFVKNGLITGGLQCQRNRFIHAYGATGFLRGGEYRFVKVGADGGEVAVYVSLLDGGAGPSIFLRVASAQAKSCAALSDFSCDQYRASDTAVTPAPQSSLLFHPGEYADLS